MDNKVRLSAPWITFYRKIDALFKNDPEVEVVYDEENYTVKVFVENPKKAEALTSLLPSERVFGLITVKVQVIPANVKAVNSAEIFKTAFENNPALSYVESTTLFAQPICYIVFKREVVQYFNDDLGDINGLCSTLYQDIAKDIFTADPNVFFCTDNK